MLSSLGRRLHRPGLAVVLALSATPGCGPDAARMLVDGAALDAGDGSASDASGAADAADATDGAPPGCPGIPIVPDDTGFVAPGSNAAAIHGSWFVYSDCADLMGQGCATVSSPPSDSFPNVGGAMCTTGHTSTSAGAWGAGIALELNDGPPQEPYDTVAAGIEGFCFQLSGPTIPTTSVRVAFPTQDNNDNAYFASVTTPGQHTVLFSSTQQGSWVTTPSPFEASKVTLIQFQIPSSPTASVSWDFCIDGLTAVTQ